MKQASNIERLRDWVFGLSESVGKHSKQLWIDRVIKRRTRLPALYELSSKVSLLS